jgi:hypothetical protein
MHLLLIEPGRITAIASPGACWATILPGSLLGGVQPPASAASPVVAFTGSYAELEGGGLFDAHPRTWARPGWERLAEACRLVTRTSEATVLIRPHARHVVSDVPGIRHFASTIAAEHPGRFGLLLDPVAMLESGHLARHDADDAIARVLDEVGTLGLPVAAIVAAAPVVDEDSVRHESLTRASADAAARRFAAAARSVIAPIVLVDRADAALEVWV